MAEAVREHILDEIKRTAEGNKPLGWRRFEKETGIKCHEWQKYWARFGEAQSEAGFNANVKNTAYTDTILFEKFIEYARQLKKFPTSADLRVKSYNDPNFPSPKTFQKRGRKNEFVEKFIQYCQSKTGYDDIISLCTNTAKTPNREKQLSGNVETNNFGFVYLIKSGRFHKIGKANDVGLRSYQLKIQLPDKAKLIHQIKTDDPHGIERYWHQRFNSKRKNGEWFELDVLDITSFKRRKFM